MCFLIFTPRSAGVVFRAGGASIELFGFAGNTELLGFGGSVAGGLEAEGAGCKIGNAGRGWTIRFVLARVWSVEATAAA